MVWTLKNNGTPFMTGLEYMPDEQLERSPEEFNEREYEEDGDDFNSWIELYAEGIVIS